jgi:hypothetical protein
MPSIQAETRTITRRIAYLARTARISAKRPSTLVRVRYSEQLDAGELRRGSGHPGNTPGIFSLIAELLSVESVEDLPSRIAGVYVLMDSARIPRYVGIAKDVRIRIRQHMRKRDFAATVRYLSLYATRTRDHAREVETLLLHFGGAELFLNAQKRRDPTRGIAKLRHYEAGTLLFLPRAYRRR